MEGRWETILSLTSSYLLYPQPEKRRQECWVRGFLESEHLGSVCFSWHLPYWEILDKSMKALSLEGPGKEYLGCSRLGSGRCLWITPQWVVVPLREAARGARRQCVPVFPGWGLQVWSRDVSCHFLQALLPSVVLWLITLVDSSTQMALEPQFSWQLLLDSTFPAAYNFN